MMYLRPTDSVCAKIRNLGFIGALLVVFIHVAPYHSGTAFISFLQCIFAAAAVPFFFLVSGYWLGLRAKEPCSYRRAVLKRLRTLGIPFLFWSVFMVVLVRIVVFASKKTVSLDGVFSQLGFNLWVQPLNHPLWYVRMLFLLVLASPLIAFVLRLRLRRVFLTALFFAYWLLSPDTGLVKWSDEWFWFVNFGFSLEGLVYFSIGFALPMMSGDAVRLPPAWVCVFVCIAGWLLEYNLPRYGFIGVAKLIIPWSLLWMWMVVPTTGFGHLPELSFPLYVLHVPVLFVCDLTLKMADLRCENEIVDTIFRWVLVVFSTCGLIVVFRRSFPRFSTWTFGGR